MFDASCSRADTGYDLEYSRRYSVTLDVISQLKDASVECEFDGWNPDDRRDKNRFHRIAGRISRFRGKPLFTLVGEVATHQIDLGALWRQSEKGPFTIHLASLFPNRDVSGRLYVYLNDVAFFYWNNTGQYVIRIQPEATE